MEAVLWTRHSFHTHALTAALWLSAQNHASQNPCRDLGEVPHAPSFPENLLLLRKVEGIVL